jgi:hypothetical protein
MLVDPASPYYVKDFAQLIAVIERHYLPCLDQRDKAFLMTIRLLEPNALALFIRLAERTPALFRIDKLAYEECAPLPRAVQDLIDAELAQLVDRNLHDDIFDCFGMTELQAALMPHRPIRFATRAACIDWLSSWEGCADFAEGLIKIQPIIAIDKSIWRFIKFLYFGNLTGALSAFVVRDLGHIVPESIEQNLIKPRFSSRDDALACFKIACLYEEFRSLRQQLDPLALFEWWQDKQSSLPKAMPAKAEQDHDQILARLGRILERSGFHSESSVVYEQARTSQSYDRLARVHLKLGNIKRAADVCLRILTDPATPEAGAAADIMLRKINRRDTISSTRMALKAADTLEIDLVACQPEKSTLEALKLEGWEGVHSENWLWSCLFGLTFWDIIYNPDYGGFHSPLQLAPDDLWGRSFYTLRQAVIDERLDRLACPQFMLATIEQHYGAKLGITNPFVNWTHDPRPVLSVLCCTSPRGAIAQILRHIAKNPISLKGFPDLFLWREGGSRFVEVKSLNDSLSPSQLQWLGLLCDAGFNATVLRVADRAENKKAS